MQKTAIMFGNKLESDVYLPRLKTGTTSFSERIHLVFS